jgi:apolipoprotein D and lipocalin family protein
MRAFVCLLFISTLIAGCDSLPENPPQTVDQVDLQKYAGLWYEIARLPVIFQKVDERATAEYRLDPEGHIALVNTAFKQSGVSNSVTGTAVPVEKSGNAKLKVSIDNFFAKLFGSPPEYGNYWILKLDSDYRYALVGSANRKTLWLLARTPQIPEPIFQEYIAHAAQAGYDTDRLIINNTLPNSER